MGERRDRSNGDLRSRMRPLARSRDHRADARARPDEQVGAGVLRSLRARYHVRLIFLFLLEN